MYLAHRSIPFNSINFTDEWNLHPWEFRDIPRELQEILVQNGVIHPPLVIADTAKTFAIVSGVRRVEFIRRFIGPAHIDCMVIDKAAPPGVILNLILTDQSHTARLSLAEKARFVEIASRFLKMEDIMTTFQARLQLPKGRSGIANLLDILKQDEQFVKEVHTGYIQDRMVLELLSLPNESDRLALMQLFKNLGMGDGKQKRFFSLIRDIAWRAGTSISAYLQKNEITAILEHQELNIPQKIQHLGSLLQNEFSPASSLAEELFAKKVKSLGLPANYSISHSPSFEKDETTLSITFRNFPECEQYLKQQLPD